MSAATTSAAGRLTDAELKAQEKAARKAEKARQKRIAADEAAERRRSAKAGFANVNNPRRSTFCARSSPCTACSRSCTC